jgi:hypothetical protein
MVLSGTLREFILADVMQLLTQQKVTGKLSLNCGNAEGYIIFRDGDIVAAAKEQESFAIKLFSYLTVYQKQPKNKVRELFTKYKDNLAELTRYLEAKNIFTHDELELYAMNMAIDIACSLFLWTSGHYQFDSIKSVDNLIPAGIDIPVENVVMEAMRRIDEWHRMHEAINEETIFIQNEVQAELPEYNSPDDDPSIYLYHRIDGTSSVKDFLTDSFLTEYKIYETLYTLVQSEAIRSLSDTVTRSIKAALQKKEQEASVASAIPPIFSFIFSTGCILIIILLSWLFRGVFSSELNIKSSVARSRLNFRIAEQHQNDAQIFFMTRSLYPTSQNDELQDYSLITKKDAFYLSLKREFAIDQH